MEEETDALRQAEEVTEAVRKLDTVEFKAFVNSFVKEKIKSKEW